MWKTLLGLWLLGWPAMGQIPGLTFEPVPFPSPRDINPFSIAAGTGGRLWFADLRFRQVGFIEPSGTITKFRLTDTVDPVNEVRPLSIVEGPDGNAWFTLYVTNSSGSPLNRSAVAKLTPSGTVTIYPMPTGNACRDFFGGPACGITVGPDNNLWFVQTQVSTVGRITLAGVITEFPVGSGFRVEITTGADGNLWASDVTGNRIWRITTSGVATSFPAPGTAPRGITRGPDGNVWFTANGTNSIGRITPQGAITMFPVPATNQLAGMNDITTGPDGNIWFTEGNDRQIGRLEITTGTVTEVPAPNNEVPFLVVSRVGFNKMGPHFIDELIEMFINSLNSSNDYNVSRAKLTPTAGPRLVIRKKAVELNFNNVDFDVAPILSRVRVGSLIVFRIRVTNEGGANSGSDWTVEDQLPEGCRFLPSVLVPPPCVATGSGLVVCSTKPPRALTLPGTFFHAAEFSIFCTVERAGRLVNRASVSGGGSPPDDSDGIEVIALDSRRFDNEVKEETLNTTTLSP